MCCIFSLKFQICDRCKVYGQLLTNVGHRFGHPSGLGKSSGRHSTDLRNDVALRVDPFVYKDDRKNIANTCCLLTDTDISGETSGGSCFKKNASGKPDRS